MNKLFKLLQESFGSSPQRHGFDLSHRSVFSVKAGGLYPVFALETVPNDYHEIRPVNLLRTMPFNQANFVRMKQHLDFFFVPYSLLYRSFDEFIQQTSDPVSAIEAINSGVNPRVPTISLGGLLCSCLNAVWWYKYTHSNQTTQQGMDNYRDTLLGCLSSVATSANANYYRILFLNSDYTMTTETGARQDIHGYPIGLNMIRLLDLLGYGNFTFFEKLDFVGNSGQQLQDAVNLCENLYSKQVSLFRLLAYQAVCQFYFKNKIYDKIDPLSYNCDDLMLEDNSTTDMLLHRCISDDMDVAYPLFDFHYRPWKMDIYTSSYPDTQFGSVSVVSSNFLGVGPNSANQNLYGVVRGNNINTGDVPPQGSGIMYAATSNGTNVSSVGNIYSTFSILDLRRAQALQGWQEDMLRAGYRASKRQFSQFGVRPNFDPHFAPIPIGSTMADVNKDVVTGTSGDQFADQAATGTSVLGQDTIKYASHDYGVIIGVYSILPEADYDAFGIDPHNTKTEPFDFYTPAFANLGLQPMQKYNMNLINFNSYGTSEASEFNKVIGYVPRYAEYKQHVDELHGEFCGLPVLLKGSLKNLYQNCVGQFRDFVSSRIDYELSTNDSLAFRYINPAVLDDIFMAAADPYQSSDQFHVNTYFEVNSVRPISELGLPRF